jgi:hypothetical protein
MTLSPKNALACHLRRAQLDRAVRCRAPHIRDAPYVVGVEPLRALIVNCKWTQRLSHQQEALFEFKCRKMVNYYAIRIIDNAHLVGADVADA